MNKFKISALSILKEQKKPLHYKEITRLALEEGILETGGATPEATMNALLSTEIKYKGNSSDFIRVSDGVYGLKSYEESELQTEAKDIEQRQDEELVIEGSYTGKAGEHLVCSELLFRGFNASIMSVDVGIDIVATKDNQLYGIQVKTANLNKFDTYVFDVRKVSFVRHSAGSIFYIFVLHAENQNQYLVLPLHEMEKKVYEKAILEVGHGKRYRVNIKIRDRKVFLGNKDHEMSYHLNNWKIIK